MLQREQDNHKSCPNRGHCKKDESKCCYLISNRKCYLELKDSEDFV